MTSWTNNIPYVHYYVYHNRLCFRFVIQFIPLEYICGDSTNNLITIFLVGKTVKSTIFLVAYSNKYMYMDL